MDFRQIARSLSPAQRHCLLRFSEAEEWDRSGYGMARTWPDIIYGRSGAQYRSLAVLVRRGLAQRVPDNSPAAQALPASAFRLTPLGLTVQLHARGLERD